MCSLACAGPEGGHLHADEAGWRLALSVKGAQHRCLPGTGALRIPTAFWQHFCSARLHLMCCVSPKIYDVIQSCKAMQLNLGLHVQARSYEEATSSLLGWYLKNAQTRALSHPLPVMRAREIDKCGPFRLRVAQLHSLPGCRTCTQCMSATTPHGQAPESGPTWAQVVSQLPVPHPGQQEPDTAGPPCRCLTVAPGSSAGQL